MTLNNIKFYTELLTPAEHLQLIKQGMAVEFHRRYGGNYTKMVKSSIDLAETLKSIVTIALGGSVLAGIPAGVAWHKLDQASTAQRRPEKETLEKIRFYKSLTTNVEDALQKADEVNNGQQSFSGFNV